MIGHIFLSACPNFRRFHCSLVRLWSLQAFLRSCRSWNACRGQRESYFLREWGKKIFYLRKIPLCYWLFFVSFVSPQACLLYSLMLELISSTPLSTRFWPSELLLLTDMMIWLDDGWADANAAKSTNSVALSLVVFSVIDSRNPFVGYTSAPLLIGLAYAAIM